MTYFTTLAELHLTLKGVSNFSTPRLRRLLSLTTIFPVVNQIEIHAHFQDKNLVAYCLENGIHVTASAPLGGAPIPALKGESEFGPLEDPVVCCSCYGGYDEAVLTVYVGLGTCGEVQENASADMPLPHSTPWYLCHPEV